MGQFKPMVKMYTDEPSVILKLKKGGKVHHKAHKEHGEHHGHKSMHHAAGGMMQGAHHAFEAEHGKAPKKPSMHERQKAMNPNQYAKGGKVHHKQLGGAMPMAGAPMAAMGRPALTAMTPAARVARAAQVRRALTGMKKGGAASAECAKLEKELKHHEAMSMEKAHPMKKASGGAIDSAETKTTLKNSVKPFAKTKMETSHKDKAHGTGEVKEGKPGGYKMGGTIEGNEKAFENTKMDTAHPDHAHGTGGVKMSNAGGFKHGGKMHHKASGGSIDKKLTRTTVEGGNWENRPANTAKAGVKGTHTGEVKESNAGGYKRGGHASKKAYATGGQVVDDGKAVKMPRHFVSRPVANSLQSGTFKKGGEVKKADGGSTKNANLWTKINPTPKEKYMRVNEPVNPNYSETAVDKAIASSNRSGRKISGKEAKAIHSLLKGRYAGGGKVGKFADGSLVNTGDAVIDREDRRMQAERNAERADNEAMRDAILGAPRRAYEAVKGMFTPTPKPAGSVTKTEKSVTVTPSRKRGGRA